MRRHIAILVGGILDDPLLAMMQWLHGCRLLYLLLIVVAGILLFALIDIGMSSVVFLLPVLALIKITAMYVLVSDVNERLHCHLLLALLHARRGGYDVASLLVARRVDMGARGVVEAGLRCIADDHATLAAACGPMVLLIGRAIVALGDFGSLRWAGVRAHGV